VHREEVYDRILSSTAGTDTDTQEDA